MPECMGSDSSQARPVAGAAQHPPSCIRCPRLAGVRAGQLHQQHPVPSLNLSALAGHVVEIGMDHGGADPFDQPAGDRAVLDRPRHLRFRPRLVGVGGPMTDVHVR